MYRGLIAATGLSTRLHDLGDGRNKVLADLGDESLLSTILTRFDLTRARPLYADHREATSRTA